MRRSCLIVAALAAGLFPGHERQVRAQGSTPDPETRPYFSLWAAPSGGWGAALFPYASQVVKIEANLATMTPQAAAQKAVTDANQQILDGVTDPNRLCFTLYGFGMYEPVEPRVQWSTNRT